MSSYSRISRLRRALALAAAVVLALGAYAQAEETNKETAPAEQPKPSPSPEAPKRAPRPGDIQRVFVIQHESVRALAQILQAFPATLSYSTYKATNALAVSASPSVVAAIEETIKRLDVPPPAAPSVDIAAYIIEALAEPTPGAAVPAVLSPVVTQLKATFRYADYRLVDTLITRAATRPGDRFEMRSISEDGDSPRRATYRVTAYPEILANEGTVVRLGNLRFEVFMRITEQTTSRTEQTGSSGTIEIRDGQYVVVGKSGTGDPGNALILVLHAKIVD